MLGGGDHGENALAEAGVDLFSDLTDDFRFLVDSGLESRGREGGREGGVCVSGEGSRGIWISFGRARRACHDGEERWKY